MKQRDWAQVQPKRDHGCRVRYECDGPIELAHTIGRRHDDLGVVAADVVPLCRKHHMLYDAREFDLLPFTDYEEQAAAVRHVGIIRAYKRLTSGIGEIA